MKLVIDIPDIMIDWLKNGYPNEDDMDKLLDIVFNATPLEKVLEDIKAEIIHLRCKQYNLRLTLDREEVLEIIDSHISGKEQE